MASILIDWGTKIAAKLGELALGEARYLICFKCIAEEFEKEKKKLVVKKNSVEEDVADARNRAENIRYEVDTWLKEADKYIKEESEKKSHEEEDTKKKITFLHRKCPKCFRLYLRGKELDEMKLEISELRKQNFEKVGRVAKVPSVEFYAPQNFIELKSRSSAYKQVLKALKDGNDYIVGLHGLGGTGKTTLAKKVGLELKQQKAFDEVVFTTVSNDPNIKKIQDEIAGSLGLQWKDETEIDRPKKLWLRLTKGGNILIILDDVWKKLDFDAIGIPFNSKEHYCKVLLTSRDAEVCSLMECEKLITLNRLDDDDAQILFENLAGISNKFPKEFKDKGKEIAKACKGLPVAVATIASTLKGRPLKVWKAALTALKSIGDTDEFIEIYKRLKVSYDHLNNDEAKKLLLLCSLFPEDYEIPEEDFIMFGTGLGLFGDVHSYKAIRTRVDKAGTKLIDSCLLLEGEEGHVKMHDLVRDAAHWIANQENQFGVLDMVPGRNVVEKQNANEIRYLYCRGIFVNDQLDWAKLEILILAVIDEDFVKEQEAFFARMKNLRVLALDNGDQWGRLNIPLPQSFESLKFLRTLRLTGFELNNITLVELLKSLEILEFKDCLINELSIGIVRLGNLRLLSMVDCKFQQNPYKVIGQLSGIQELYFKNIYKIGSGETWDLDKGAVANLFGKGNISMTLQRYYIEVRDGSRSYGWTFDHSISRALAIQYFDPDASNAAIKDLVRRAECLDLLQIQGEYKAIIPDIIEAIGGEMKDLASFTLYSCSKIEYLIDATRIHSLSTAKTVFSKLDELFFYNMDALRTLCYSSHPQELSFDRLKRVHVKRCPLLTSVFTLSIAHSLVALEELVIEECKELKYIIIDEQSGEEKKAEDGHVQMFQKLKKLKIRDCDQIEFIFPVFSATDLQQLKTIKISSCGELKYIFGQCQLDDHVSHPNEKEIILPSLEKVDLNEVPKFVNVFPKCCHPNLDSLSTDKSTSRKDLVVEHQAPHKCFSFPWVHMFCFSHTYEHKSRSSKNQENLNVSKVEHLDFTGSLGLQTSNFGCVCPSDATQCLLGQSLMLRNVKSIRLIICGKIESLFTLSTTSTMLVEELTIKGCHGLSYIITDMGDSHDRVDIFPNLKELTVKDCSNLKYIVEVHNINVHINLLALEDLDLCNLPTMVGICSINDRAMCPSLNNLSVDNCPEFAVKSLSDFIVGLDAIELDRTTTEMSNSKGLLPINTTQCFLRQSMMLQHVKSVTLINCRKIESLFTLSTASIILWEELRIEVCYELKYTITDIGDNHARISIFPKLKLLQVDDCSKLKYVVGRYHCEGPSDDTDIHIDLPALEDLRLRNLPNMVGICPMNCYATCPSLNMLSINDCSEFAVKSIGDFKVGLVEGHLHRAPTKDSYVECLLRRSLMLRNVKIMKVRNWGTTESLFALSTASTMLVEQLTIEKCHELKYIITDIGDNHDRISIFPKLKLLKVDECSKLEYVVGRNHCEVPNDDIDIHIDLPALEDLFLRDLPNMVNICPINYYATYPSLNTLSMINCSELAVKSISDFMVGFDERYLDRTPTKGIERIVKHLETLDLLYLKNLKIEGIFYVEEPSIKDARTVTSRATELTLKHLFGLKYIWNGPKHFFALRNLKQLIIKGCGELEVIFCVSIMRTIPQLKVLMIRNCPKLEKIVEEDEDNPVPQQVCFPELKVLVVKDCNKLEHMLSMSSPNEFPKLEVMMIQEASQLKQVFRGKIEGEDEIEEEANQVVLPKLKCVILVQLPNLTNVCGGFQLERVVYQYVCDCNSNITPTSSIAILLSFKDECLGFEDAMDLGFDLRWKLDNLIMQIIESGDETTIENPTAETTTASSQMGIENLNSDIMEAATENEQSSSQKDEQLISEPSLKDQPQAHGETENTMKIPQEIHTIKETEEESIREYSKSKETENVGIEKTKEKSLRIHMVSSSTISKTESVQSSPSFNHVHKEELVEKQLMREPNSKDQQEALEKTKNSLDTFEATNSNEEMEERNIQSGFGLIGEFVVENGSTKANHVITSSEIDGAQLRPSITLSNKPSQVIAEEYSKSKEADHKGELMDEASAKDNQEALAKSKNSHEILEATNSIEKMKGWNFQEHLSRKADQMITSSTGLETRKGQLSPSITLVDEASQTETYSAMDSKVNPVKLQNVEGENFNQSKDKDGVAKIAEESPADKDNLVAKVLLDLEVYLKMCLKDLASSNTNSIRLQTCLNFLSRLSAEDGALSNELKLMIDSLQQEFPGILSSFKEAFAKVKKFAELEEIEKSIKGNLNKQAKADLYLSSKISQINMLKEEAQQKEATFKNHISKLQAKLERATKDKSQMVEKQRKSQQRLLKMEYEWSFLCSQFHHYYGARMASTSTHFGSGSSSVVHPHKASPQGEVNQAMEENAIQVCMPMVSVTATENPVADNLVLKALADLEVYLKMSLQDIAFSEDYSLRLHTALNFLSRLSFEDLSLSDELKAITNSLQQNFPSIICSFKEAFAMTEDFAEPKEREKSIEGELVPQKEATGTFDFKFPETKKFIVEAEQKEAIFKERISWVQVELESVKDEIKELVASLSYLEEEKNKCVEDIKRLEMELETVKRDKYPMVEDQRKAQKELFQMDYKWSALCSRFEMSRIVVRRNL